MRVGYYNTIPFHDMPVYGPDGKKVGAMSGSFNNVLDRVEMLTMPDGKAIECLHLMSTTTQLLDVGGGSANSETFEFWLARGIGQVRSMINPGEFLTLESATVNGQTYSFARAQGAFPRATISDPKGNLQGDTTRAYLDILQAELSLHNGLYTFTVRTAAPFPEPKDMTGKRIDIVLFVDTDRNTKTGPDIGNEYNIDLFLDHNGWGANWYKVTEAARNDGIAISQDELRIEANGAQASLSFPMYYLPSSLFDWWVYCGTINAPSWTPRTDNPGTARGTFALTKAF
ncbi:MAG: hypothetical protein Kow0099_14580 [Candidatus Abyssubacteria bacterium]